MLLALAIILAVLWVVGFLIFHIAGMLIHVLIIVAAIMIIMQVVGGRRAP